MDRVTLKRVAAITQTTQTTQTKEDTLLSQVWVAESFCQRLRGLLFRPELKKSQGLLIKPCRQIHTVGMSYSLDIIFLDQHGTVIKLCHSVKPFRQAFALKAAFTLEMASGVARDLGLNIGDQLAW